MNQRPSGANGKADQRCIRQWFSPE